MEWGRVRLGRGLIFLCAPWPPALREGRGMGGEGWEEKGGSCGVQQNP